MRMRARLFFAGVLLVLAAPAARADDARSAVARGDALFAGRTVSTGAAEALALYRQAAADDPTNAAALWKASRALHWLGDHATGAAQRAYYEDGIRAGKAAVALNPDSPNARFWLGALYGSYGEARGVLKSLSLVKPVREQMMAIADIDPRYGGGAAARVLGIVDYKVPGFAGGSKKRAAELLAEALKIDPANAFNHYYMAEFLAQTGKKGGAAAELDAVRRSSTTKDVDGPDLAMIQGKARALEAKLAR